jgi:class 3 adenylate cyclase
MESSGRTLVCSVLFLDIVEYTKKPVAEQLHLKQAFNRTLAAALDQVAVRDRIILDTGDGAAVTFMGDPEDALFAAMTVRDAAAVVPLRLGINLGPVRLVKDLNGQMNIIGDGINVAQRVMSFATPGQLMVSRSFYEVVSCLSRDYANLFRHEGARTDKHVREHDVYSVVGAPAPRSPAQRTLPGGAGGGWLSRPGPLGFRRSALAAAAGVFVATLVGGALAARALMQPAAPPIAAMLKPAAPVAPAQAPEPAPAPKPAARPLDELFPPKPAAPAPKAVARVEKTPVKKAERPAAVVPGKLELAVQPWGEVLVDGKSRGVSPPLRVLEIFAGPHTIEIRNTTFPAYKQRIEVKSGEVVRIRHRFK